MTTTAPTPARRTYASLRDERGFLNEYDVPGRVLVSICPMNIRSCWRHVEGSGKPTSKDALYEEVGP